MTKVDPTHGSAVGIPEPPRPAISPISIVAPRRRRSRWRGLLWSLLIVVVAVVAIILQKRSSDSDTSAIESLEVGDCFNAPDDASLTPDSIDVIDCGQPHNHEVYAIGTTATAIDTALGAERNPEIVRICRTEVPEAIFDSLARASGVTPGVLATQGKAGRLVCTANTAERTGSLVESATAS